MDLSGVSVFVDLDVHRRTVLDCVCTACWAEWHGDRARCSAIAAAHLSPTVVAVDTTVLGKTLRHIRVPAPRPVQDAPL